MCRIDETKKSGRGKGPFDRTTNNANKSNSAENKASEQSSFKMELDAEMLGQGNGTH